MACCGVAWRAVPCCGEARYGEARNHLRATPGDEPPVVKRMRRPVGVNVRDNDDDDDHDRDSEAGGAVSAPPAAFSVCGGAVSR